MVRSRWPKRDGSGTWRIICSAVGGRKALRTPCRAIRSKARSGSNFAMRCASTGTPWNRRGSSTSSSPPIQAQSAGVQNRSPGCGNISCGISTPGRWPSSVAMRVQRALRRAGGARGVDDQRRIVGRGRRPRGRRRWRAPPRRHSDRTPGRAPSAPRTVRSPGSRSRTSAERGEAGIVGDERRRAAVAQAELQRIRPEQLEQRHGDRADPVDGEMRERRLRPLRQQHRDAVAARDALRLQHVAQARRCRSAARRR